MRRTGKMKGVGPRGGLGRAARIAPLLAVVAAAGCGSNGIPPATLIVSASWNDDPGAVAAIGYRTRVDIFWQHREEDCFPLPSDLTVAVNDQQVVPPSMGDCSSIFLPFDAVAPDAPVDVRFFSGTHVYGEATYDNLFPGFGAQIAASSSSQVPAGGQIEVLLPAAAVPVAPNLLSGDFYWTDPGSAGVPFHTFASGMAGPDPQSVILTAPSTPTGAATLVIRGVFQTVDGGAKSCTGFTSCASEPDSQNAGPVSVVVTP